MLSDIELINLRQLFPVLSQQVNDHHKLEALWVTWGLNQVDAGLLKELLKSTDHRIRAAAVRVLRFNTERIDDHVPLFMAAANDEHGRVRLEAITAASWLGKEDGLAILETAAGKPLDRHIKSSHKFAAGYLNNEEVFEDFALMGNSYKNLKTGLEGMAKDLFIKGSEIYSREGHCSTCHQTDGKGLPHSGFPPLDKSKWVTGSEDRLIKLTLHGLHGPITVKGKDYPGHVPMTAFKHLLDEEEVAAVLTFVRNAFGNSAGVVSKDAVTRVRKATKDKEGFYSPEELLKEHPLP